MSNILFLNYFIIYIITFKNNPYKPNENNLKNVL